MMNSASAGSLESGDIYIEISPIDKPVIEIKLKSIVAHQFGKRIKAVIEQTVAARGISGVAVNAVDKGARDCTVRARVDAALNRGLGVTDIKWE